MWSAATCRRCPGREKRRLVAALKMGESGDKSPHASFRKSGDKSPHASFRKSGDKSPHASFRKSGDKSPHSTFGNVSLIFESFAGLSWLRKISVGAGPKLERSGKLAAGRFLLSLMSSNHAQCVVRTRV